MKVLVTGASGFLGAWMVRRLVELGHDVRILARASSDLTEIKDLKFEKALGDVTDADSVEKAAEGVDTVFHLAGLIGYSRAQRAAMEKVNVEGTQNVVNACAKLKTRKLVYMSSVVAVGASFDGKNPLNENSQYNLEHLDLGYFETKRKAEKIVKAACDENKINAVILNPSTIYGAGDAKKGSRKTQLKVAQGKFPFYTSGGVNVVNVHDVVESTLRAWEVGKNGERYILSGENITIKKLFELIAEAAQVPPPRFQIPNVALFSLGKVGDALEKIGKKGPVNSENAWTSTLYHWFDSSKAQRELGLKITPAKESIRQSVDWVKKSGRM